jgi:acrylyl-CoA reductase (NADPH)
MRHDSRIAFSALVVEAGEAKTYLSGRSKQRTIDDLPDGDVLIRVNYSSLNYKDALSAIGNKGVTRSYPHTPGIDAAGTVADSRVDAFKTGDPVLVTGYDLGMNTSGGFGQYVRVPAEWVVPLPGGLSLKESMIYRYGRVHRRHGHPFSHRAGQARQTDRYWSPVPPVGWAASPWPYWPGWDTRWRRSPAKRPRRNFSRVSARRRSSPGPMLPTPAAGRCSRAQWAGVVDTVGGEILATAIKSTHPWGTVTCCGNVASPDLPLTVFPFILRGVRLIGIDSQNCPMDIRLRCGKHLAGDWKIDGLDGLCKEIGLDGLNENIDLILKGLQKGRVVVNLGGCEGHRCGRFYKIDRFPAISV